MTEKNQNDPQHNSIFPLKINELEQRIKNTFENKSDEDLYFSTYEHKSKKIAVFGISYLIDNNEVMSSLLSPLLSEKKAWTSTRLLNDLPLSEGNTTESLQGILDGLVTGSVYIYIEDEARIVFYPMLKEEKREIMKPENESVVLGPQLSFTESLGTNLNILRQLIPSDDLVMEKLNIGNDIPREVRLIYMKSIANDVDVNTMRQRLQELDVDEINDVTVLKQYLEDSASDIFPQFALTELPAQINYNLKAGKVAVIAESSPYAFTGPSNFFGFFESMEDMYMRWNAATALRLLRMFSIAITLFLTPLYVAIVTYQYQLIPDALLVSIGKSRSAVPFPPILEAILIEIMIELLREASARMPTKVGATMGIVGGIVIGEAAVQAGIASNILIIVVAVSALASFTTPDYLIGTSFRVIRFPMILLAGIYGVIGVMFGACFLIIHLLKTKSLGHPYLAPIYPFKFKDFSSVFYRPTPSQNSRRPSMYRPKDKTRYSKREAMKKRDIEE